MLPCVKAELQAITEADIPAVAAFLNSDLNPRVSAEAWAAAMASSWSAPAPNHGYFLRAEGEVVGAYLAFYSERLVGRETERFCNLGAWCVRPDYRFQSFRLLQALLKQTDYSFTDFSPSGNVIPLNTKLGFEFLDTSTALIPNLPWPTIPGRTTITSDPDLIGARLSGPEREIFEDHRTAAAAIHLLVSTKSGSCYVILRRDRRKGLPLFASLLYASNPALLAAAIRPLTRFLLLRRRIPITLIEDRVLGRNLGWFNSPRFERRKMYKSSRLGPQQIDNLYSELVCVPW
jgi:hypothetical protein